ncbi:MAG: polysaccharide biosynthesis tyrosine autokinase [Candidatus Brocadiae bacterium]|nr:polysaccharide biosynthesis tyrosine autokinase [Candidatus Brocadiia bacterium]
MPAPASQGPSAQQLLLILRRRWRLLAIVWLVTAGGVAVWTFTQTRQYRPQVTLEIRPEQSVLQGTDDPTLGASGSMWENYYRTQENILTSPSLVEETLKSLPEPLRRDYESRPDPVRELTEQIDIEQVRNSFVLRVGIVDPDPEKASQIANTLISIFLEDTNRRLREVKSEAVEALSRDTLPGIRRQVEEAEAAVRNFQATSGYIDQEEQYRTLLEGWRKVSTTLVDVRLRRIKLAAELEALATYRADGTGSEFHPTFHQTKSLESLTSERDRLTEALAAARLQYKERHPRVLELETGIREVEGQIRAAIEGALVALQKDLTAVLTEEKALSEEIRATETLLAAAGTRLTDYRRLEGEVTAAKELYASYVKRHGESSATAGTGVSSVRIIDNARPTKEPWKPKIPLNLALGCLAGLVLGGGATLLADQLDNRILSAEEVEAFLGMDVLTVVPRLEGMPEGGPAALGENSTIAEFEAFRGLRAEVQMRLEKLGAGRVLAVLSPLQGEGKTTVTVNLARVLAMDGKRVLIIDADMRKPKLKGFLREKAGPGLDEVLSGTVRVEAAARASTIDGVDIVGVSEGMHAAAELANSAHLDTAIREARERWDVILIDNAPVLQASESALIARRADGAILVLREGRTGRTVAQAAARRLKGMGVRMLGAVLNCSTGQGGAYGYGYGYGEAPRGGSRAPARG